MIPAAIKRIFSRSSYINSIWFHMSLILVAGTAAYCNSFHVPFVLDDYYNASYVGPKGLGELLIRGGGRRIADITFALNYRFSGLQVTGYHVTNLMIHLATALFLYFLTRSSITALCPPSRSGGERGREPWFIERFLPLATGLLFVSHPVQTQAVTYIIQRYTSLAAFLYLLSALAFVKARLVIEQREAQWKAWTWGGTSLLAATLAVGTKQNSITLPLMLILLEICLFRGRFLGRRFFMGCAALLVLVSAVFLYQWLNGSLGYFLYDLRHATTDDYYASRTTYFFTQLRVIVTYLRLLFVPINQSLFYDYPVYSSFLSLPVLASAALHVSLISSACIMLRLSRVSGTSAVSPREPSLRLAALGIFWFYLALSVESSFIPIRDVIFEHRIYLPSAGFFMTICALAAMIVRERPPGKTTAWVFLVVACLVFGCMTIERNRIWSDSLELWQESVRNAPGNGLVHANLANEYSRLRMPEKALPLLVRAIELKPDLFFRTKILLGLVLLELHVPESRFTTGQEFILPGGTLGTGALDYSRLSEWDAAIHNNIGLAHEFMGELVKARRVFEQVVNNYPAYDLAWYNLGLLAKRLNDAGQLAQSIEQLRALNPALADSLTAKTRP